MSDLDTIEPTVVVSRDGAIATVTLDRPAKMNALDGEAWDALGNAVSALQADPSVRAIVLRGAGGNFCAGADVSAARAPEHPLRRMRRITDVVRTLFEAPVPTIAAVDGVAVGAGWNIALACDFVVATDRARFSQIFAKRGLSVDCGGSWLLPRIVGLQAAKRLLYLAEMIPAAEAHAMGLTHAITTVDEHDAVVAELAARLAAAPPVALAQNKSLLNESFGATFAEQLLRENTAQSINFATDAPTARAAIAAKTQPVFEGRWQL